MNAQADPQPAERLIVALDVATAAEALALVRQLRPTASFFKIGLQLYTACGPEIVRELRSEGASVFLDLKLYDIGNTVRHAVEAAAQLDVQMLTIHLSGGRAMIEAAVVAAGTSLLLLGVTVLTSSDAETLAQTGVSGSVEEQVLRLAKLGESAGIRGFVASPHELPALRRSLGEEAKLVIPGVRPACSDVGDQKRIMTPHDAIARGADYLVIGRPITAHAQPREALERIVAEISA